MGPLPIGRLNRHVGESYGPDNNIMKFYITEYSSKTGRDGFQPRYGHHVGTGYKSNFRPGVYYSRKLDELDNPVMGRIVSGNYQSITHKHYQPSKGSNGKDELPSHVSILSNGFVKDQHRTVPSYREAHSVFANPESNSLCAKPPILHTLGNKCPIGKENNNNGPALFSTENHSQFIKKDQIVDTASKTVGPKEDSGFTRSKNLEPVTFRPDECHDGMLPPWCTWRPTGSSVMKRHYKGFQNPDGSEKFQGILPNADRENGFTRYIRPTAAHTANKNQVYTNLEDLKNPDAIGTIKKSNPAEYINLMYPSQFPSVSGALYRGKQLHEPNLADNLGKLTIGEKEDTGYTENNKSYTQKPRSGDDFNTIYENSYYDKNKYFPTSYDKVRDDHVAEPKGDGYTKSEKLHLNAFGETIEKQRYFQELHPYVNRSLKARDPFYAEKIYEHKKKSLITA